MRKFITGNFSENDECYECLHLLFLRLEDFYKELESNRGTAINNQKQQYNGALNIQRQKSLKNTSTKEANCRYTSATLLK